MRSRRRGRIAPTRLSPLDLLGEAVSGILARPGRTALTMLGVVLGVGTVVAVLGITTTATAQISERFTVLAATEVTVKAAGFDFETPRPQTSRPAFPDDADARARQIKGVNNAGLARMVTSPEVTGVPLPGARPHAVPVLGATPGYLPALRAEVGAGRLFDTGHAERFDPVAVLGRSAARRLGIDRLDAQPVIFLGDIPFTVIGIVDDVQRKADTLSSIVIPLRTADELWSVLESEEDGEPPEMVVDTELGAAPVVAEQLALALRPDDPAALSVVPPPDPKTLKQNVQGDLNTLFLLLAAICLIIGMVGIANTTLVAVLERTAEIGLRRALGARKRHVAAQFLTESALVGTVGGTVGAATGVLAIIGVALAEQWTPILEPAAVLPAPLLGSVVGILAGLYPATKAAGIPPAEAFRR